MEDLQYEYGARSIFWMFLRTIPEPIEDDHHQTVAKETFMKEFTAAVTPFREGPAFDYTAFHTHARAPGKQRAFDEKFCNDVAHNLCRRINQMGILFPRVQRRKNMSWDSGQQLNVERPSIQPMKARTVDLEIHYARTGVKIGGVAEVRTAWKFNDLKPRAYYCQGGDSYWPARYMRDFAVALMESIPATQMKRRLNPHEYLKQHTETDHLVTWDFTAFTSTLSELKFFMAEVIKAVSNLAYYDVRLFDYEQGIITASPIELLQEYNEQVNMRSEFSIHRVVHKFFEDTGVYEFRMANSGMLGVGGNIGFSTADHGFETTRTLLDTDRATCIGDDAMGSDIQDPADRIIPRMSLLGNIHPAKFSYLNPGEEGPLKYVKRAMFRYNDDSMWLSPLYDIPLAPYIDMAIGFRTIRGEDQMSIYNRVKRVATSTGQCLFQLHKFSWEVSDSDLKTLSTFLRLCYHRLGLRFKGALPGFQDKKNGIAYKFCLPPLPSEYFDPRSEDWLEELFRTCDQPFVEVPIMLGNFPVYKPSIGDTIEAPSYRFWNCLEDLGYVKVKRLYERVTSLSEHNRSRLRRLVSSRIAKTQIAVQVVVVDHIPDKYDSLFDHDPHLGSYLAGVEI